MEPTLPSPVYFGTRRAWRLSDIVAYERALAGLPSLPPPDPADEQWLTAAQLRARFGGVSDMWLHRRLAAARDRQAA
jgi:hypothetical protein